jgi:hypothetical protein
LGPDSARQQLRAASLELARLRRIRGASHRTWRRIARARRRLALAAALVAAAAPAPQPAAALDPVFRHGFILDPVGASYRFNAPVFADIDGDGDPDLFLGSQPGNTHFFENTGTTDQPKFAPAVIDPFGLSDAGSYAAPAFADLDGDGDLDALVSAGPVRTLFFLNTGTATAPAFAAPVTNAFGLASFFLEISDLDADGDLDALGTNGGVLTFHENTGSATAPAFAAPVSNPFGLSGPGDPDLADVDGDGDLDAFVGLYGYGYTISFFENTGSASAPAFAAPVSNPFGLLPWSFSLAEFADVDGDGDLDAVLAGRYYESERVTAFENTGTANAPAFSPLGNPFGFGLERSYSASSALDLGDIDGDGDLDAFVSESYQFSLSFARNTGAASAPAFAPGAPAFGALGVEPDLLDIDADGDLDLFSGSGNRTLFFRNTGSAAAPSFAASVSNPFGLTGVCCTWYAAPSFADIDGDGDFDALVGDHLGNIAFFRNTGSASAPAFAAPSTNPFGLADVGYRASPTFMDVDGDGDLDAWVGNSNGDTLWFRNTGTATAPAFAAPLPNPFGLVSVGSWQAAPAFADVDADGDLDALIGAGEARVFFFENVAIDADACRDGIDNDGDGRIDVGPGAGTDPGCAGASDTSELGTKQCDNGQDDDGDGKIDFRPNGTGDPQCSGPLDDREAPDPPPGPACGLGPELLLLAPLLAAERRRRERLRA